MKVIKLYQLKECRSDSKHPEKPKYNPEKPEYYHLVRSDIFVNGQGMKQGNALLVNYPIDKPNSKREARWFYTDEVHVEWVKTFLFEGLCKVGGEKHGV